MVFKTIFIHIGTVAESPEHERWAGVTMTSAPGETTGAKSKRVPAEWLDLAVNGPTVLSAESRLRTFVQVTAK